MFGPRSKLLSLDDGSYISKCNPRAAASDNRGPIPRTMWHLFRSYISTTIRNDQNAFLKLHLSELPIRGFTNARIALLLETVMLFRLYIVHGSPINDRTVCLMGARKLDSVIDQYPIRCILLTRPTTGESFTKKDDRQQFCTAHQKDHWKLITLSCSLGGH